MSAPIKHYFRIISRVQLRLEASVSQLFPSVFYQSAVVHFSRQLPNVDAVGITSESIDSSNQETNMILFRLLTVG